MYGNASLPISCTNLNYVNGHIDGQSDYYTNFSNIVSCETQTSTSATFTATALSLSLSTKSPLYLIAIPSGALNMTLTLNTPLFVLNNPDPRSSGFKNTFRSKDAIQKVGSLMRGFNFS